MATTAPARRRVNSFFIIVCSILVTAYLYLGWGLIRPLNLPSLVMSSAWMFLLLPFGLILWLPLVYWQLDDIDDTHAPMLWAAFGSMSLLSFLFFYLLLRDFTIGVTALGLLISQSTQNVSDVIPALLGARGTSLIAMLTSVSLAAGFLGARRAPTVVRMDVPIQNLAPSLEGLKIAQISDLHISSTIRKPFVETVVGILNELKPDLVAMTGDLVDGTVSQLQDDFAVLGQIQAPLGRFYVTGNHEYYWEHKAWIEHVGTLGIRALTNSHVVIEHQGAKIAVAGVLDYWAERNGGDVPTDPKAAIEGAPQDSLKILLAHQPKTALTAAPFGYDLQLSGHTHGGQFLPWTIAVKAAQPFVKGLYKVGSMQLYVNRGTGYWGPPMRLGAASEITLLRLVRG